MLDFLAVQGALAGNATTTGHAVRPEMKNRFRLRFTYQSYSFKSSLINIRSNSVRIQEVFLSEFITTPGFLKMRISQRFLGHSVGEDRTGWNTLRNENGNQLKKRPNTMPKQTVGETIKNDAETIKNLFLNGKYSLNETLSV